MLNRELNIQELQRATEVATDLTFSKRVREGALREVGRLERLLDMEALGSMNYGGK